ncbi:MAG: hypothetical protein B7Z81_13030 [Acidocella sp. 20-61-6]|nr:MAG: hypothetical protein B7Z81_13030 [Acidocella sp. 20-61-6]
MIGRALLPGLFWILTSACAVAQEVAVTIPTRPGVLQSFLADIPAHPVAAVILFPATDDPFPITFDLSGAPGSPSRDFLIRTRKMFVAANIATLALDVPSDKLGGLTEAFREGPDQATDLDAAIAWLKQRANVPVWLVGTNLGSITAAANAIRLGPAIGGVVLTSSVSVVTPNAPDGGVLGLDLAALRVPALIMEDTEDACHPSPPADAARIAASMAHAPRREVKRIDGGASPKTGPCGPLSFHSYYGVEPQAVGAITAFITAP